MFGDVRYVLVGKKFGAGHGGICCYGRGKDSVYKFLSRDCEHRFGR